MAALTAKQQEAKEAYEREGSLKGAGNALGINKNSVKKRLRAAGLWSGENVTAGTSTQALGGSKIPVPPPSKQPPEQIAGAARRQAGLSRAEARNAYDVPCRLTTALDAFIQGMEKGMLYEEAEVRRACKVSQKEQDYWQEITSLSQYAQYYGYTENGTRLWGTPSDIEWAASTEGITGFVPGTGGETYA